MNPVESDCLFAFKGAAISRPGDMTVLTNLNWTVREGETWAIVGPVGSGKTTLTEALTGRLHLAEGEIVWPFIDRLLAEGKTVNWPSEVIERVSFKEESRLFSYGRHYYQQRYNFIEPEDDLSLDAFLRSGTSVTDATIREFVGRLGIAPLLELSLIKLSNGQIRRARIAKALLHRPELLILDDPFMGLDVAGRREIAQILGGLIEQGTRIVLVARPELIPEWVTHVLELDGRSVRWQGSRKDYREAVESPARARGPEPSSPERERRPDAEPIIDLRNVNITYGDRAILKNVSWSVRPGERWAVLGPNGSGKSTLLSLICGDHPQAYSNDIKLFGVQRGSGESIWDIKRNIGLVSPELHLYFSEALTALQTAATGFFDVLAYRRISEQQEQVVRGLFDRFELTPVGNRLFSRLSTGQQRLVLLIRALVKQPQVLVLDEPFQGFDHRIVLLVQRWLDEHLTPEQTLIFVSHYADEIPGSVNQVLRLNEGVAVVESID